MQGCGKITVYLVIGCALWPSFRVIWDWPDPFVDHLPWGWRAEFCLCFVFNSFIWLIVSTIRWVRGFLWLSGSHHMAFRYFAFIYRWRYPGLLFGRIWALLDQGHFRTSAKLCLTSVFLSNVACIMRWSPRSVWGMLFWFAMRWRLLSMKDHP